MLQANNDMRYRGERGYQQNYIKLTTTHCTREKTSREPSTKEDILLTTCSLRMYLAAIVI